MIVVIIKVLVDNVINQVVAAVIKARLDLDNHQITISRRAHFARTPFVISQSLIITNQGSFFSYHVTSHFEEYLYTNEVTIGR